MFTGGPLHLPFLAKGKHWFDLFRLNGVQVVFSGHEHNFQLSERNSETGDIQFVVSGAGGELRRASILKQMGKRHIAAWSNQPHFLAVTIERDGMSIQPVGINPIHVVDPVGKLVTQPVRIKSKKD
jgi:hypothetical protein